MPAKDKRNPIVSVIVPMFNTASYLKSCISSVLCQTFDSYELILVDDGSTDKTQQICQQFCIKDSRIQFISCPDHKGISHARNLGIDASSGRYLFFLDSDDCIHPQLLEQMLKEAGPTQADITRVEYVTSSEMDETAWEKYCAGSYHPKWTVSCGEANLEQWCKERGRDSVRQTLYRRESVGNLRFDETIDIAEDALFNYEFMTNMPRIYAYSDTPGYYYRIRMDSIMRKPSLEQLLTWVGIRFKIRDQELSAHRTQYALILERENVLRMRFWMYNNAKDKAEIAIVRQKLKEERHHPLFRSLSLGQRLKVFLTCYCLPVNNLLITIKQKAKRG